MALSLRTNMINLRLSVVILVVFNLSLIFADVCIPTQHRIFTKQDLETSKFTFFFCGKKLLQYILDNLFKVQGKVIHFESSIYLSFRI